MALSFPLPLADFWNRLDLYENPIELETYQSTSGTRGGEILTAELAEAKWRVEASIIPVPNNGADALKATINTLINRGSGGTFMLSNKKRSGPRADPTGAGLAGYSPTVLGLSGRRGIRFAGLPPGYVISAGDFFSIAFASNPTRYAYMQSAEYVTANGAGQTAFVDVVPFVKAGVTTGQSVSFVTARMKAMIRPGSFDPGSVGLLHTTGMRFTAIEAF